VCRDHHSKGLVPANSNQRKENESTSQKQGEMQQRKKFIKEVTQKDKTELVKSVAADLLNDLRRITKNVKSVIIGWNQSQGKGRGRGNEIILNTKTKGEEGKRQKGNGSKQKQNKGLKKKRGGKEAPIWQYDEGIRWGKIICGVGTGYTTGGSGGIEEEDRSDRA